MHVLILADIEGSSGCWSKTAAASMTRAWRKACWDMTTDVRQVILALQKAGVARITVHDFHRSGYNIFPEKMPSGCRVISGYRAAPVPGLGDPEDADLLMMIGMHAPSGSKGFLAHTLTSRVASLHVNGHLLSEAQLFAAALFSYGIRPVFFSGCPVACRQAENAIGGIATFSIDKSIKKKDFDARIWRKGLGQAAVEALSNKRALPYRMHGPFAVRLELRDGPKATVKLARRWNLEHNGRILYFDCPTFAELYDRLLCICYLTPLLARHRSKALRLYSLWGRIGSLWARSLKGNTGNN